MAKRKKTQPKVSDRDVQAVIDSAFQTVAREKGEPFAIFLRDQGLLTDDDLINAATKPVDVDTDAILAKYGLN